MHTSSIFLFLHILMLPTSENMLLIWVLMSKCMTKGYPAWEGVMLKQSFGEGQRKNIDHKEACIFSPSFGTPSSNTVMHHRLVTDCQNMWERMLDRNFIR